METGEMLKTGKLNRETAPEALHEMLFAWGKRWWGTPAAGQAYFNEGALVFGAKTTITPLVMANVSIANWQQQTLTQLCHALMLALSKKGRDADASYVLHLQQTQRAGEIPLQECLERLERLCAKEMTELPVDIRAKLASIRVEIH